MKLMNKKTGEIVELRSKQQLYEDEPHLFLDTKNGRQFYTSLSELNEEWEDYEEPKGYWYMSNRGDIRYIDDEDTDWDNGRKQIGNHFDTREEAEKAVEKLKAFKRLKDKGLKFKLCAGIARGNIKYYLTEESDETEKDLRTCFGGEE